MRGKIMLSILVLTLMACAERPATEKILFDFETDADLDRLHWSCHTLMSLTDQHETHGQRCLRLELFPSDYPGLAPILVEHDWRPYKALVFDLHNPQGKEIQITVRIDDKENACEYADRYNESFRLGPGANSVEILLDRLMTSGTRRNLDLKNIYQVLFFMVNPSEEVTLYVDYIRLSR